MKKFYKIIFTSILFVILNFTVEVKAETECVYEKSGVKVTVTEVGGKAKIDFNQDNADTYDSFSDTHFRYSNDLKPKDFIKDSNLTCIDIYVAYKSPVFYFYTDRAKAEKKSSNVTVVQSGVGGCIGLELENALKYLDDSFNLAQSAAEWTSKFTIEHNDCADPEKIITRYDKCLEKYRNNRTMLKSRDNSLKSYVIDGCISEDNEKYKAYKASYQQFLDNETRMTEEIEKGKSEIDEEMGLKEPSSPSPAPTTPDRPGELVDGCGLLGEEFYEFLQDTFSWMQIIGPIIALVLSMVDFIGAIASGEEDAKKKATKKASTRVLAAFLLFLIPAILKLILSLINKTNGSTCGIGE